MKKKKTQRGRPPKQDEDRRDIILRVRATADEAETLKGGAARAGADLSGWMRQLALREARKSES